jgi:hypothetical protein
MDDGRWDSGVSVLPAHLTPTELNFKSCGFTPFQEPAVSPSLAVSSSTEIPAPPFARTCQASHLLSRILSHINFKPTDMRQHYTDGILLHQVLEAFHRGISHELQNSGPSAFNALSTANAICYSALIALYDHHSCAEADNPAGVGLEEQLRIQEISLTSLQTHVGPAIHDFAQTISELVDREGLQVTNPFLAPCLYSAAVQYKWYIRETNRSDLGGVLSVLMRALTDVGLRWDIASRRHPPSEERQCASFTDLLPRPLLIHPRHCSLASVA